MSQFDKTTERNAWTSDPVAWKDGRNSAKESLEILARTLENLLNNPVATGMGAAIRDHARRHGTGVDDPMVEARLAIAHVKAAGNWPLSEDK